MGIIAVLSLAVIQNSYAQTDAVPPLILISPENYEIITDKFPHTYAVSTSQFVVVDDSGQSTTLYCALDSEPRKIIHSSVRFQIEEGIHTIMCDIEDQSQNVSTVSWQVNASLDVELAPDWVKTVGELYCDSTITELHYLKVMKYLQWADVMMFDIYGSGSGEVPDDFKQNTCSWKDGNLSDSEYKIILEDMASNGVFENVTF